MAPLVAMILLLAQSPDPGGASSPLKSKIVNVPGTPATIDSCRAFSRVEPNGLIENLAYVRLHNSSKKPIEVIAVSLIPFTAFNDPAGKAKTSLLNVNLAPGAEMNEDYSFTDGAKEPLMGGMGVLGKWQDWESDTYQINCVVSRVRFADGTTW